MAKPQAPLVELSAVLRVLSSPTRREILARLASETHYPLQLSKELGVSQQAIMKHIRVLQEAGLVEGIEEPSDQGGPPRTAYKLTASLSIAIDLGPALFSTRLEVFEAQERAEARRLPQEPLAPREALSMRLSDLSKQAGDIAREIDHLERRRDELVARRMRVLAEAHNLIARLSDAYLSRRVLYWITEADDFSLPRLSEHFDLRERVAQDIYRELLREHLVPEYKIRRLR
ncbi:MAG TPA: helix-turn-helix domain-containing protein [Candidatus Thermoplasmatota archaeon]|nr:helix-turn-helix domain-containing protein [Candidatus Thermoplasmatota archaeon]